MHRNWVHLIAEFHQLCCRQLALIIESLHAIFIQIRLNRDLEGRVTKHRYLPLSFD